MTAEQSLVFLDPGPDRHPKSVTLALSRFANEHRDVGTPVVWLRPTPEFEIPKTDTVLDIRVADALPSASPGSHPGRRETFALSRTIAVVEAMAEHGVPPAQCFAYGDLCVDHVVLTLVGNPRVVPCSPYQAKLARSRGFVVTAGEPE